MPARRTPDAPANVCSCPPPGPKDCHGGDHRVGRTRWAVAGTAMLLSVGAKFCQQAACRRGQTKLRVCRRRCGGVGGCRAKACSRTPGRTRRRPPTRGPSSLQHRNAKALRLWQQWQQKCKERQCVSLAHLGPPRWCRSAPAHCSTGMPGPRPANTC